MGIVEIVGIAGAAASIVGLALYLWHRRRKTLTLSQSRSSIVIGNTNQVDIMDSSVPSTPTLPNGAIVQQHSSIIVGSGNRVDIRVAEKNEYETSIIITRQYRHLVEFSLSSTGGLTEVLQLYVELLKLYDCITSSTMREAMSFRNNYSLLLVPTMKIYPIIPPTLNNSQDTWVLRGKDVDLYSVQFGWPPMTAAYIIIKADLLDHGSKTEKHICSRVVSLDRNGESREETSHVPLDNRLSVSPYLYKLMTVCDFIARTSQPEFRQLNDLAYAEIAGLFKLSPCEFAHAMETQDEAELIFAAEVHPSLAMNLLHLSQKLRLATIGK